MNCTKTTAEIILARQQSNNGAFNLKRITTKNPDTLKTDSAPTLGKADIQKGY